MLLRLQKVPNRTGGHCLDHRHVQFTSSQGVDIHLPWASLLLIFCAGLPVATSNRVRFVDTGPAACHRHMDLIHQCGALDIMSHVHAIYRISDRGPLHTIRQVGDHHLPPWTSQLKNKNTTPTHGSSVLEHRPRTMCVHCDGSNAQVKFHVTCETKTWDLHD